MSKTIIHRLRTWAIEAPEQHAQKYKKSGEWIPITARDLVDRIFALSQYLESEGLGKDDGVCIYSYNNPQWIHFDLAPHLLGCKTAGIYPNSTGEDVQYIIQNTEAKVLCVQNKDYFLKATHGKGDAGLPSHVKRVVFFEGDAGASQLGVTYDAALEKGRTLAKAKRLEDYLDRMDPHAGSFLIYTSGTTGQPKGAMISHDNLCFSCDGFMERWNIPRNDVVLFSFLPLCHVAEKLHGIGIAATARGCVNFCTRFENIATELQEVEPTVLLCVPRVWEKMMEGVESKLKQAKGIKKAVATWALSVGEIVSDRKYSDIGWGFSDVLSFKAAEKLAIGKIRKALGMARVMRAASGAAALSPQVARWFRAIGIEILEDFGQTESTGVLSCTIPGEDCLGTVGKPHPGTELKIAEDGEILTRGEHVFKGYYKNPTATAETVVDGWLHTGDLGVITEKGFLKIIGRKKEVMKTSGGKMIAPNPIEAKLSAAPMIGQACVVGEGRKYLTALLTLSEQGMKMLETPPSGSPNGEVEKFVVSDQKILGEVKKTIDEVNESLASYEKIKNFKVLARDFSIEAGEMTPTMKMKRSVVEKRFQQVIDSMYR